jgi:hypothetical protein
VSTEEQQGNAIDLLAQLCERQGELSTAAHVAVMEAFNSCVELTPAVLYDGPRSADSIAALLWRSARTLEQLSRTLEPPCLRVTYAAAQALVELAISER